MERGFERGERRQRGSTETTKAVTYADHGIADQAVFRGITAAVTSKGPEQALAP
jgi:hypothetical protein